VDAGATETQIAAIRRAFLENLASHQGKDLSFAGRNDRYLALAYTVRERLIERWLATLHAYDAVDAKVVYYFSAEFLPGRQLANNLLNTDLTETVRAALAGLGLDLDDLSEMEAEPGLGNGGLGRLAACFLDSLATLRIPAVGYGIRYRYGIFRQRFEEGWQVEVADDWTRRGDPWSFPHPEQRVEVAFGGRTEPFTDRAGRYRVRWVPESRVLGIPYNMMVPGYRSGTVNTLRLWEARATEAFDLQIFNTGDYTRAVGRQTLSENISQVLYPDDSTPQGKTLRLQQQYFFVACSLADIVRIFRARYKTGWDGFPDKVAIQLNDTHPTIGIAELMRLLVDEHLLGWEQAWAITRRTFSYTNHTLLPEALEEWPVAILGRLLPRHLEIIYEINRRFLDEVRLRYPGDDGRVARLSIIGEWPEKRVRMAHLACVGSHAINGVAEIQSGLLRERVLPDFAALWPEKFSNKTNGVTPRRFMRLANPRLAALITERIGDGWLADLDRLRDLEPFADDPEFRAAWRAIKRENKATLARVVARRMDLAIDPASLYDVMVKRLHEYKRQLLKALHVIALYRRFRADPDAAILPRTVVFGAKAAPGYRMAKLIIRLINGVAEVVNNDPASRHRLRVAFIPNFNVSLAERIYPAADLSEQISLAGKEASGTGNMKFALNGALTIGTLDGANIEIRDLVGPENFFLFGLTTEEVFALRERGYRPRDHYEADPELRAVIDAIAAGDFSRGDAGLFRPLVDGLLNDDPYMLLADYGAYVAAQDAVERVYRDEEAWTRMSILNTARCGFFSSDRTIRQYCEEIWGAQPVGVGVAAD
jgi:glycogen phosphorylase